MSKTTKKTGKAFTIEIPGLDGQETGTRYVVKGLQKLDRMPVVFRGTEYDLARLSEKQLAYLKQFPKAFPYLA